MFRNHAPRDITKVEAEALLKRFLDKPDRFDKVDQLVFVSLTKRGKFVVSPALRQKKPSQYAVHKYNAVVEGSELARWRKPNLVTAAFSNGLIVELTRDGSVTAYQQNLSAKMEGKENG